MHSWRAFGLDSYHTSRWRVMYMPVPSLRMEGCSEWRYALIALASVSTTPLLGSEFISSQVPNMSCLLHSRLTVDESYLEIWTEWFGCGIAKAARSCWL